MWLHVMTTPMDVSYVFNQRNHMPIGPLTQKELS